MGDLNTFHFIGKKFVIHNNVLSPDGASVCSSLDPGLVARIDEQTEAMLIKKATKELDIKELPANLQETVEIGELKSNLQYTIKPVEEMQPDALTFLENVVAFTQSDFSSEI